MIVRQCNMLKILVSLCILSSHLQAKVHKEDRIDKNIKDKFPERASAEISGYIGTNGTNTKLSRSNSAYRYREHKPRCKGRSCRKDKVPSTRTDDKDFDFRLPRDVKPMHYILRLHPSPQTMNFTGFVKIKLNITSPTQTVVLHSNKLSILSVNLTNKEMRQEDFGVNFRLITDRKQLLIVETNEEIPVGYFTLKIDFAGDLEGLVGLYVTKHRNGNNVVATHFEPTHAREAFPCFDEPNFKATFDVTLVKPYGTDVVLSNMNEASRSLDSETFLEAIQFATSVPMSTYLLSFVIGEYDFQETEVKSMGIGKNFPLRSYVQGLEKKKATFAQHIATKGVEYFIKYFDVPFPLPKLDLIAIPGYAPSATENWGLITFKEAHFLVDKYTTTLDMKMKIAKTITHELSQMWFGNLVTMEWWDELWLKQSFAIFMSYKCLVEIRPSWHMTDLFIIEVYPAMMDDATLPNRPLLDAHFDVKGPKQIYNLYKSVPYIKGAAILRMLETIMGSVNFRKGVSDFLEEYEFKNTGTEDLYSSLGKHFDSQDSDLTVSYLMDIWTRETGYPVLSVRETSKGTYEITQSRFLLDTITELPDLEKKRFWCVPITFKTNGSVSTQMYLLRNTEKTISITADNASWIKFNNNQLGFYRVNYPDYMWQNLIQVLESGKPDTLTAVDRAQLLTDAFALAEANLVSYDLPLNMTKYLLVEEDSTPWIIASMEFNKLLRRLYNTTSFAPLQAYIRKIIRPIYETKFTSEVSKMSLIENLTRPTILSLAAEAELPNAITLILDMLGAWLDSSESIERVSAKQKTRSNTDLRKTVYYYGMKYNTQLEWNDIWQIYKNVKDPEERELLLNALAAIQDKIALNKYLSRIKNETDKDNVRKEDYLSVICSISANPLGTDIAWNYVRNNWEDITSRFNKSTNNELGSLVATVTSSFNTETKLKELDEFFTANQEYFPEWRRQTTRERVCINIAWTKKRASKVARWLRQFA